MNERYDVVVVGAGIVGLATAYRLLQARPGLRLAVVEKERDVGLHQSSHNSGVVHAGVYYTPGSLKARLCRAGRQELKRFCEERGIPVHQRGKVVVAVHEGELGRLDELAHRAGNNQVPGIRQVSATELREIEPAVAGIRGLYSPQTAVVDFLQVCRALAAEVSRLGGDIVLQASVTALREAAAEAAVETTAGACTARVVATCGGLQADRLARLSGVDREFAVVPFRGSWYVLAESAKRLCRGNIYPVPDPRFPFLGVHLTRRADDTIWVGPNAVLAGGRETYRRGRGSLRDIAAVAGYPGFWRLAAKYAGTGTREMWRDHAVGSYLREVQRYVPELTGEDLVARTAGIRAQVVRRDGGLIDDFLVRGSPRIVHVINAPSPAATSSLAIGSQVSAEVTSRLD